MENNKIVPINRVNKFFSEEDFFLEINMARETFEGDNNMSIVLYRVNREMTESDNVYGEASKGGIKYFSPVELKVFPKLATPENKTYNKNGSLQFLQDGQLTFIIYDKQLEELEVDISYGDYIGYQVNETEIRYYSVVNAGQKNFDNGHTIMGYKGVARTVVCASVDASEFNSI